MRGHVGAFLCSPLLGKCGCPTGNDPHGGRWCGSEMQLCLTVCVLLRWGNAVSEVLAWLGLFLDRVHISVLVRAWPARAEEDAHAGGAGCAAGTQYAQ